MTMLFTSLGSATASLLAVGALMASTLPDLSLAAPLASGSTLHLRDLPIVKRDVWSPPITDPTAGDVLRVGDSFTVTWDTSTEPTEVTDYNGTLLLGHTDSSGSENLDTEHPLATGFDLRDGSHTIVVPDVPPLSSYIIVLMGDSGNTSPEFTISSTDGSEPATASDSETTAADESKPADDEHESTDNAKYLTLFT